MQQFTEDMFNRIIDFQEKKHPVWNLNASFNDRITGLPLHYFIFSNYDRDPSKFGPTLAHYYPLSEEMRKLAYFTKCAAVTQIVDYYPGNGLIGSLLARAAKLKTQGLAYHNAKPAQIPTLFDPDYYSLLDQAEPFKPADNAAYFVSWVPSGENPFPDIVEQHPALIIYVGTEHINSETGERQVGVDNMLDALQQQYSLWDSWEVLRAENVLQKIWPDMTGNIEEVRQVKVFARNDLIAPAPFPVSFSAPFSANQESDIYPWEQDLQMAELAALAMSLVGPAH